MSPPDEARQTGEELARLRAERDAYRGQRDDLANAIGAHAYHHPAQANEADRELWNAYRYVIAPVTPPGRSKRRSCPWSSYAASEASPPSRRWT